MEDNEDMEVDEEESYFERRHREAKAELERRRQEQAANPGRLVLMNETEVQCLEAILRSADIQYQRRIQQQQQQRQRNDAAIAAANQPGSSRADTTQPLSISTQPTNEPPPQPALQPGALFRRHMQSDATKGLVNGRQMMAEEVARREAAGQAKRKLFDKALSEGSPLKRARILEGVPILHTPTHLGQQNNPFKPDQTDPTNLDACTDFSIDPADRGMHAIYLQRWQHNIRTRFVADPTTDREFVCYLRNDSQRITMKQLLTQIYSKQTSAFKINIEYSAILQNLETGEMRYFFNAENTRIFTKDRRITNYSDLTTLIADVDNYDFGLHSASLRPNTKWVLRKVTNAVVKVLREPRIIGGCVEKLKLPKYLLRNKGLKNFIYKPEGTQRQYRDHLCFFRCFVEHWASKEGLSLKPERQERRVEAFFNGFWQDKLGMDPEQFDGMSLEQLDAAEAHLKVPIYVFELGPYVNESRRRTKLREFEREGRLPYEEHGGVDATDLEEALVMEEELQQEAIKKRRFAATCIRKPAPEILHDGQATFGAMYLNRFVSRNGSAHYSYIHDIEAYSKCYTCDKCKRPFHKHDHLQRHIPKCKGVRILHYFPGNGATIKPMLFDKLKLKYGFRIPEKLKYHPYVGAYDFESCYDQRPVDELQQLELGTHLTLPDDEDPQQPPDGLPQNVLDHWDILHSRIGPDRNYCVVRQPVRKRIPDYVKSMAKMQTRRFAMTVILHTWDNDKLNHRRMPISGLITNSVEMEAFLTTLNNEAFNRYSNKKPILAVRIQCKQQKQDFTADLIPASVAIATNVPGFGDNAGKPKAHFILSDGNTRDFVRRFVCKLLDMSQASAKLMRKRFGPILRRLDQMWLEIHHRKMHQILRDVMKAKIAELEQQLDNIHCPDDEEKENNMKLQKLLDFMNKHYHDHDRELASVTCRDVEEVEYQAELREINGQQVRGVPLLSARRLGDTKKIFSKIRPLMDEEQKREYYNARRQAAELKQMYKELEGYCHTFNLFGFNSAKFDTNLVRRELLTELRQWQEKPLLKESKRRRVQMAKHYIKWRLNKPRGMTLIKRGKAYLSIHSSRLRFLDMSHFCAQGTSYDAWLKSRNVQGAKFHFPHEWFTGLHKLDEGLPPIEQFYSQLKGHGIKPAEYEDIKRVWRERGWTTMREHLEYYNACDVVPFIEGIESMQQFFAEHGHIDIVAGPCISLPGMAERMLFTSMDPSVSIALPQKTKRVDNSDLFTSVNAAIVGGPAVVYRRYAEALKTRIRTADDDPNGELCQKIVGYDANCLYLKSAMEAQACGLPRRWTKAEDGTWSSAPFYRYKQSETEWLAWEAHCRQQTIYHRFNGGIELFGVKKPNKGNLPPEVSPSKDLRINGVSVDGYCPETNTCLFFDGCLWHQHLIERDRLCPLALSFNQQCKHEQDGRTAADLEKARKIRKKDYAKREQLKEAGYNVVVMNECKWKEYTKDRTLTTLQYIDAEHGPIQGQGAHPNEHTRLYDFRKQFFGLPIHPKSPMLTDFANKCRAGMHYRDDFDPVETRIWEDIAAKRTPKIPKFGEDAELIDAVKDGRFFGVVEVDLEMPDKMPEAEFMQRRFAEFAPVFKNVEIRVEDIGEHMQQYVKEHGMESKFPKRSLIGSTFCHRTPMITPLLQWYLKNGFLATKVYKAFEYVPIKCFEKFGNEVVAARRKSDADPLYGPLGEMFKLIGNSTYGKSITNIEIHQLVSIVDEGKMDEKARDPFYKTSESLLDGWHEVAMEKEHVVHQLNRLFGFFVYGYAKLRMIQFYHDFIDKFIPRSKYELIHMDTDSLYMAIAGPSLDALVPDKFKEQYEIARPLFLPAREDPQKTLDKRAPGIFKLEFEGMAVVALNPKTYYIKAFPGPNAKDKFSCKGLPKNQNELTFEAYKQVLDTGKSLSGKVMTFMYRTAPGDGGRAAEAGEENESTETKRQRLMLVEQEKTGLSYLMVKRIVLADGIRTENIKL